MNFWGIARLLGVLTVVLIAIGCGDQYRPVAVPIIPPQPNPQSIHFALVLSDNGLIDPGASTRLDVSGDTSVAVAQLGVNPAHAALLPNGARVFAVNTMEDSVSSFSPAPGSTTTPVFTTSLPTGSSPVFVHTTENGTVWVANYGSNTVAAVSTATNGVTNPLITVGNHPVALAETPDQKKLYAANQGDGTVTAISLVDRTVSQTIATGAAPVWVLARADSERVYVLNSGSGTVSAIDTTADALLSSVPVGAGANYMAYDAKLNRLYVTNPTANTVTAVNVATDPPAVLFTVPVAANPLSVAVLPDGTRAYVASSSKIPPCTPNPADLQVCITSSVTVINTGNGSIRKTIPLESTISITAASQSAPSSNFNFSTTTYTYTLVSGPALRPGMELVIAGMADAGNNGTFSIVAVNAGTITVANGAGSTSSAQSGTGAVVIEISTVNPTGCDTAGLGVPSGVLGGVRFRDSSTASADSSKVFIGKCDSGSTAVVRTSDDSPVLDIPAPLGSITPPNGGNALPQNPVFVLAGP